MRQWNGSVEAQRQADISYGKMLLSSKKAPGKKKPARKTKAQRRAEKKTRSLLTKKNRNGSYVDYKAYLKSKRWLAKRLKLFAVRGRACEQCGSTVTIHVHHKTYERLGNEKLNDLMVLCKACHDVIHEDSGHFSELSNEYFRFVETMK